MIEKYKETADFLKSKIKQTDNIIKKTKEFWNEKRNQLQADKSRTEMKESLRRSKTQVSAVSQEKSNTFYLQMKRINIWTVETVKRNVAGLGTAGVKQWKTM